MRGPAIFLLSLVGAAAVGAVALRPAVAERDRLRAELEATAAHEDTTPSAVIEARDRLKAELGGGGAEGLRAQIRELAGRFALAPLPLTDGPEIAFTTGFDRLSALLSAISEVAGALDGVRVTTVDRTDRCRVVLTLREGPR